MVVNGDSTKEVSTNWECPKSSINVIKDLGKDAFGNICKGAAKNFHDFENGSVMVRILKRMLSTGWILSSRDSVYFLKLINNSCGKFKRIKV